MADAAPSFVALPDLEGRTGEFAVTGDEAHYLSRVVRVRPGERVTATDGAGLVVTLEVVATGGELRVREVRRERHARGRRLEIWCGAPEGDRADWLVEKLGELGVATLVPVNASRGRWDRADARRARWDRLALAALRQSRSAWRLEVTPPRSLAEAVAGLGEGTSRFLCRQDGPPAAACGFLACGERAVVAVGPSSGFDDGELKALSDKGFGGMRLGRQRLRTETAALAVAALWVAADNG